MVDFGWAAPIAAADGGWLCRRSARRPDRRRRRRADDAVADFDLRRAARKSRSAPICSTPRSPRPPAAGATMSPTMSIGRSCCGSRPEACRPRRSCSRSWPFFRSIPWQLAHWIRMGLVVALPLSGLAIVLYPFVTRTAPRNDDGRCAAAHGSDRSVRRGAWAARHADLGRGRRHRRHRACRALSHAAGQAPGGLRHRPCRAAHAASAGSAISASAMSIPASCWRCSCGSIPGILLGARLAGLAPEWLLRPILAVTLCYAAWALFNKG